MHVRREAASDVGAISAVQRAAFGRSSEAELVEALRRRAAPQLSLVAELGGRVVGHVFFSPVQLEGPGAPSAAALAPVGVDPDAQGRGVGSALVRAGLEGCRGLGWRAVFLVGDPAWYARFGFRLAAPLGFRYGDPTFDRALQVIELEAGSLRGFAGRVRFHRAFATTGTG